MPLRARRQEFARHGGLTVGRHAQLREDSLLTSAQKPQDHSQQVAVDRLGDIAGERPPGWIA